MKYLDQKAESIRLFLVEGEPCLEQFLLLAENSFVWNDFVVTFGILGESHFVNFIRNDKNLTEICACTDAKFDPATSTLIEKNSLVKIPKLPVTHKWENFQYSFTYRHIDYQRGNELLSDLRSVTIDGNSKFLQYHFPTRFFFSKEAVTEVFIKTTDQNLFIRTIHTYPNNNMAVTTESSLKRNL